MTQRRLWTGPDGGQVDLEDLFNAACVTLASNIRGEDGTFQRLWGGPKPDSKVVRTSSGIVKSGAGFYYGYLVTTALSAAAITVYDNTAASGDVIDVIPASTAAGTRGVLATPIPCSTGIYASFGGTGTVVFLPL